MPSPQPDYRPVVDDRADLERSPDQVAHEAAMTEIAETLANIEQAIRRAERGRKKRRPAAADLAGCAAGMRSSLIVGMSAPKEATPST